VHDQTLLPCIETILADVSYRKIFGKIDMTNSFFQTLVHPDDIPLTAVNTPFGMYEWVAIPIGETNAPATNQQHMTQALLPFIRKICHVYMDDIIIWSNIVKEHKENVWKMLEAL